VATWKEIHAAEPEFADAVQARFDAYRHKTLATLRADGAPRISGIEAQFSDGEVWLGSMPGALKARDLLRDPRLALHSGTEDPDEDPTAMAGRTVDAKLAGRAVEVTDPDTLARFAQGAPPGPFHLFRVDVTEVVLIRIGDPADHLDIQIWTPDRGLRVERR
jgi:hypothetical protein